MLFLKTFFKYCLKYIITSDFVLYELSSGLSTFRCQIQKSFLKDSSYDQTCLYGLAFHDNFL